MSKKILIFLTITIILGGFLRFYKNTQNPPSLNIDEVSIGYNAYSILKTGKDEHGVFMPLSFESVGDYKPPVLIYLTVPSIYLFGLNDFAVRFPTALISTLSILLFYFLFREFCQSNKITIAGTILLTISPWHIYYSRYAVEALVALFFLGLGVLGLLRLFKERVWILVAPLSLALSMYTYHSERLFVPLFVLAFLIVNRDRFMKNPKRSIVFLLTLGILVLPLFLSTIFGPDSTRAQVTFITRDIEYTRNVLVQPKEIFGISGSLIGFFDNDYFLLFFHFIRKYLNYFEPSFLFYSGLGMTMPDTYGIGVLYLFEVVFIILGIVVLLKNKIDKKIEDNYKILILWILLGIIPAALTQNEQHPLRTLLILPAVIMISALGASYLLGLLQKISLKSYRYMSFLSLGVLIVFNLIYVYLMFAVHFPIQRGEAFMEGTKEVVEYAITNKDKYQELVFDPVRGIEGPFIVSIPHMYILFYSGFDPAVYQVTQKRTENETYGFDKFTIRKIDWLTDQNKKDILLIGSPWSIPEKDLKPEQILEKVYLSNGKLAFLIVKP